MRRAGPTLLLDTSVLVARRARLERSCHLDTQDSCPPCRLLHITSIKSFQNFMKSRPQS